MFPDMGDDWDLQAVVRGCCTITTTTTTTTTTATATGDPTTARQEEPILSCFPPPPPPPPRLGLDQNDQQALCFPDLLETLTPLEELEALYKPFFPKVESVSPQNIHGRIVTGQHRQQPKQKPQQEQQQMNSPQRPTGPTSAAATTTTSHSQTPRSKRRKNQQKRVVCQVPAEGVSSDMWAWRKYGQKPIKGSPYPRSYYRCSSSKGCLARKQVERSRSDPGIIIITYTAEHNHPVPTHRNSLAGSTRNKFPTPQSSSTPADEPGTPTTNKASSSSPLSTAIDSPKSPSTGAEATKQESKEEEEEEEEMIMDNDEDDDLLIPDMMMGDDFFEGLDELDGQTSAAALDDSFDDQLPATFPPSWFSHNATTAAGGS